MSVGGLAGRTVEIVVISLHWDFKRPAKENLGWNGIRGKELKGSTLNLGEFLWIIGGGSLMDDGSSGD